MQLLDAFVLSVHVFFLLLSYQLMVTHSTDIDMHCEFVHFAGNKTWVKLASKKIGLLNTVIKLTNHCFTLNTFTYPCVVVKWYSYCTHVLLAS
jgi:hypothetical protein